MRPDATPATTKSYGLSQRHGRRRPGRWLAMTYAGIVVVMALLVRAAEGWAPLFFLYGLGETSFWMVVIASAIALFALESRWLLPSTPWQSSDFAVGSAKGQQTKMSLHQHAMEVEATLPEEYALCKAWWADTGKPVSAEEWASALASQERGDRGRKEPSPLP